MSASSKPTLDPDFDSAIAKLLLTVDLPTPPFPEATAIIWVSFLLLKKIRPNHQAS